MEIRSQGTDEAPPVLSSLAMNDRHPLWFSLISVQKCEVTAKESRHPVETTGTTGMGTAVALPAR